MKKFILCFFMLMTVSSVLRADTVSFEATVSSSKISLNDALQLTLTFTGVNQSLDPVSLPAVDGFTAKYVGPSTSVSIINGDYHSERSFIYNLFPNKVGRFQIPAITTTIAGQTYKTKPIDVEVSESPPQAQQSSGGVSEPSSAESLKDKVTIAVSVDKTNVYVNERVALTIKLLVNGVPMRDIQYPQFDKTGFRMDDFQKPQQNSEIVNGVRYDTVEFKTNIYPNHLGDLTIGPVQIQGNVIYKSNQNNPFNQDNDFFGGNIFNNFFDSYTTRPVTVTAQPIQMHVAPLPEDGRPQDFSGAIGQFDFHAGVSPLQVKAGDPMTLRMDLRGSGNLKSVEMPIFQGAGFKTYAPQIKDGVDEKTAEEVIVPTSDRTREVPALRFSYFDPSAKDYRTITQGPFAIQVTAPSPEQSFKAIGFSEAGREPSMVLTNQFSFIKMFKDIYKILRELCTLIWFWVSLGFIFVLGVTDFLWRRFQDKLKNDPAFARRLKAAKEAKQALIQARGYISAGKSKDFYALLSKVLHDYLANKWHQSSAALSMEEISGHLKAAKIDEAHITQVRTILEQSDLVCFAGAHRDIASMQSDLLVTQSLINYLQQHLK